MAAQVRGRHPWFPDKQFSVFVDPDTWLVRRRTDDDDNQVTELTKPTQPMELCGSTESYADMSRERDRR